MLKFLILLLLHFCVIPNFAYLNCTRPKFADTYFKEGLISIVHITNGNSEKAVSELKNYPGLLDPLIAKGIYATFILSGLENPDKIELKTPYTVGGNEIWEELDRSPEGHTFLFDRCGRFTYEVIMPWALLCFPYVKAAILSSAFDNVRGPCPSLLPNENSDDQNDYFGLFKPTFAPTIEKPVKIDYITEKNGTIPVKVVIHLEHNHEGDRTNYSDMEFVLGTPEIHSHLEDTVESAVKNFKENVNYEEEFESNLPLIEEYNGKIFEFNNNLDYPQVLEIPQIPEKTTKAPVPIDAATNDAGSMKADYDVENEDYEIHPPAFEASTKPTEKQILQRHYDKLRKWLNIVV